MDQVANRLLFLPGQRGAVRIEQSRDLIGQALREEKQA